MTKNESSRFYIWVDLFARLILLCIQQCHSPRQKVKWLLFYFIYIDTAYFIHQVLTNKLFLRALSFKLGHNTKYMKIQVELSSKNPNSSGWLKQWPPFSLPKTSNLSQNYQVLATCTLRKYPLQLEFSQRIRILTLLPKYSLLHITVVPHLFMVSLVAVYPWNNQKY